MGRFEVFTVNKANSFEQARSMQLDDDSLAFIMQHGIAMPPDNRSSILDYIKINSAHAAALQKISQMIIDYNFEDEEKVGEAKDFIENIYTKTGSPQSFITLNQGIMYDKAALSSYMLEVIRINNKMVNLVPTRIQDIYITQKRDAYYQLLSDYDYQKFSIYGKKEEGLNELVGSLEGDRFNDWYPTPRYYSAIQAMKLNRYYQLSNQTFFDNASNIDWAVIIEGEQLCQEAREQIKRELTTNYAGYANSHKNIVMNTESGKIRLQKLDSLQREVGFLQDRQLNDQEVITAHGIPKDLINYFSGSSGIESGEKFTGALKIYLQTEIRPKLSILENFWNRLFANEFPSYKTKIKFKTIDLTDERADSEIGKIRAETYEILQRIGNKQLTNEFRAENRLPEMTDSEFKIFAPEPVAEQITDTEKAIKSIARVIKRI